ncbi:MAG TPA: YHS domain-containing protein [Sedimentisphaerales bacterium]|nr:YHS domain-containing protein [Sedimentisphaerales bacterium]
MNSKTKKNNAMFVVASLLLVGLIALNGCKKSEPTPTETAAETMQGEEMAMMDEPADAVAAVVEQTDCPVMGGAINKALFTEYKGQKVYFCCPGCKEKFEEEPEKYIAKLPQFKQ